MKTDKEQMILARLSSLFGRRDLAAARLAAIDAKIDAETKKLARERGICFLRPDVLRKEVGR